MTYRTLLHAAHVAGEGPISLTEALGCVNAVMALLKAHTDEGTMREVSRQLLRIADVEKDGELVPNDGMSVGEALALAARIERTWPGAIAVREDRNTVLTVLRADGQCLKRFFSQAEWEEYWKPEQEEAHE